MSGWNRKWPLYIPINRHSARFESEHSSCQDAVHGSIFRPWSSHEGPKIVQVTRCIHRFLLGTVRYALKRYSALILAHEAIQSQRLSGSKLWPGPAVDPYCRRVLLFARYTRQGWCMGTRKYRMADSLGNIYANQGRPNDAEELYEQALRGVEEASGWEHPLTLKTVGNLGNIYASQGRLNYAEEMYRRAVQRYQELGWEDPLTLRTIDSLRKIRAQLQDR